MTKLHRATLPLLAAAALALLSACENDYGSLAGIQAEIEQKGNEAFRRTSVSRVLRFDGRYYAATAKLYSRPAAAGAWTPVAVASSSDYSLLSVANSDTTLYASIYADGDNSLHSYDGTAWTPIDAAAIPASSWIDGLFVANGVLFAQAHNNYANESDDTYSLFYLVGSALALVDSSVATTAFPFVGAEGDGTELWIATERVLYAGTAPDSIFTDITSDSGISALASTSIMMSLHYSAIVPGALFAGTADGHVVRYDGATTNQDLGSSPIIALGDDGSSLFAGLGITSSARLGGYYLGSPAAPLALASGEDGAIDQYSTTVDGRAILDFFWDSVGSRFFVCVAPGADSAGYGLYSTTPASHAWIAE